MAGLPPTPHPGNPLVVTPTALHRGSLQVYRGAWTVGGGCRVMQPSADRACRRAQRVPAGPLDPAQPLPAVVADDAAHPAGHQHQHPARGAVPGEREGGAHGGGVPVVHAFTLSSCFVFVCLRMRVIWCCMFFFVSVNNPTSCNLYYRATQESCVLLPILLEFSISQFFQFFLPACCLSTSFCFLSQSLFQFGATEVDAEIQE